MPRAGAVARRRKPAGDRRVAALYLAAARETLDRYLPRIVRCLGELSEQQIWWRPNRTSNSAGNLTLHLCGNIRQWIISGLGGAPDVRIRDAEFSERGPLPRGILIRRLRQTVREALLVLRSLPPAALTRRYIIQGFRVTGLYAVFNVVEHFSHHAGQIIYITKMKRARNLRFTILPAISKRLDHI
jgi:Protein of unknown function (DUF1572)